MPSSANNFKRASERFLERRTDPRYDVREKAVIVNNAGYQEGSLGDLSTTGAHVLTEDRPEIGSKLVIYADEFGRLEGQVVRHTRSGIGLTLKGDEKSRRSLFWKIKNYGRRMIRNPNTVSAESIRVLIETLAIAGRIAAIKGEGNPMFWRAVEQARREGLVTTHPISPGIVAVELTKNSQKLLDEAIF